EPEGQRQPEDFGETRREGPTFLRADSQESVGYYGPVYWLTAFNGARASRPMRTREKFMRRSQRSTVSRQTSPGLFVFARISQKELRHITHVLETLTGV